MHSTEVVAEKNEKRQKNLKGTKPGEVVGSQQNKKF